MKRWMLAYVATVLMAIATPFLVLALETEPEALPPVREVVPYGEIVRGECS